MHAHHLYQSYSSSCAQPCSGEIHHFELIDSYEEPGLGVSQTGDLLAAASHLNQLNILPRTCIEVFMQILVPVCDGRCECPHCISQSYQRTRVWRQAQCRQEAILMNHWNTWMNMGEIDLGPTTGQLEACSSRPKIIQILKISRKGNGLSKPSSIISQEKVS